MKKVIVTGVTGFIGSKLAAVMLENGVQVYGIGLQEQKMKKFSGYKNFVPICAEFSEYGNLAEIIKDRDFDVFFHLAWAGGFTQAIKDYKLQCLNAGYAGDAVMAAKQLQCKKFVYAGTYNQYEIMNFLGNSKFEPRYTCIYSTAKTAAGLIIRTLTHNLGLEYSGGLIPMPYGENNYSKQLVNVVLNNLNQGIAPKLVEGKNLYDLVYIDDIAHGLIAIAEKGKNQHEYYIGHRKLKTFREWMQDIRNIVAPHVELKFGEYLDNQNIDYSMIDLDELYNDTGFECKADFNDTIKKTAEWVRTIQF